MPNMKTYVAMHNQKILKVGNPPSPPGCNCRSGPLDCPFNGECLAKNVVYRATVTEEVSGKSETYAGLTSRPFKTRLGEHKTSMNNEAYKTKSNLAIHCWNLKDKGVSYNLSWEKVENAQPFNPVNKRCRLCLREKFYIMYRRNGASLNKRNEIFNTCRHRTKSLLSI